MSEFSELSAYYPLDHLQIYRKSQSHALTMMWRIPLIVIPWESKQDAPENNQATHGAPSPRTATAGRTQSLSGAPQENNQNHPEVTEAPGPQ
jgi:hypothetical protein